MGHVRLSVSDRLGTPDGVIRMVGGTEVSRQHTNDAYGGYTTVILDMPEAPEGAHTMTPMFVRHQDGRVALSTIEYRDADGHLLTSAARPT